MGWKDSFNWIGAYWLIISPFEILIHFDQLFWNMCSLSWTGHTEMSNSLVAGFLQPTYTIFIFSNDSKLKISKNWCDQSRWFSSTRLSQISRCPKFRRRNEHNENGFRKSLRFMLRGTGVTDPDGFPPRVFPKFHDSQSSDVETNTTTMVSGSPWDLC